MIFSFFSDEFIWSITGLFELILFLIIIFLLINNFGIIKSFFVSKFSKQDSIIILFLLVFGIGVRLFFFDNTHANLYDEFLYIQHSRELLENGKILTPIRSIGWIFLLSIWFLVFGISSYSGFILSIFIGSLLPILIYILTKLIFKQYIISFFSSLLFLVLPFSIFWSLRIETNLPALFFILLSLIFYILFVISKNIRIFYLIIAMTIFSSTFRGENIIILYSTLLLVSLLNFKIIFYNTKNLIKYVLFFTICFFLALPNYINQYRFTNSQDWSYGEEIDFFKNVKLFLTGFFNNGLFSSINYIVLIGLVYFLYIFYNSKSKRKFLYIILLPFLLLFIIYNNIWLKHVSGMSRLFLEIYPLYAIFYGIGIYAFIKLFKIIKIKYIKESIILLFTILTFSNIIFLNNFLQVSDYKRLQTVFSKDFGEVLSRNNKCIYILYNPVYYNSFYDFSYAYNYQYSMDESFRNYINFNFDCIIFVDDKYCYDSSFGQTFRGPDGRLSTEYCNDIKQNNSLDLIKNTGIGKLKYGLYYIKNL